MTGGGAGFIWLIIAAIAKKTVRPFLMYHILQSIFLYILYFLVKVFLGFAIVVLLRIPVIKYLTVKITYPLITPIPFIFNLSPIQLFTTTVILYLAITAFMGYYSYIPWVSDIIKGNTRH